MLKNKDSGAMIIATLTMAFGAFVLIRTLVMDEPITMISTTLHTSSQLDGTLAHVAGVIMIGIGLIIALRA